MALQTINAIILAIILECHTAFEALAWHILIPSDKLYSEANNLVIESFPEVKWTEYSIQESNWKLVGWISFWKYEF